MACNYYKNIKSMRLKCEIEKNGKCERLTHFTLSLCQLWYCMIKISSHFNLPKNKISRKFSTIFHWKSQFQYLKWPIIAKIRSIKSLFAYKVNNFDQKSLKPIFKEKNRKPTEINLFRCFEFLNTSDQVRVLCFYTVRSTCKSHDESHGG